eukprot:12982738-Alexandrium_andersonii.AAC.1
MVLRWAMVELWVLELMFWWMLVPSWRSSKKVAIGVALERAPGFSPSWRAVSYTHLRAHETSAHL